MTTIEAPADARSEPADPHIASAEQEIRAAYAAARSTRLRTMREFAEQEVILPSGQYQGLRFRCDRQPFVGLWFDAVDSGRWSRFAVTGPSQSGKSLAGYVIPVCYHLFELRETVVLGLPDMDMARDKWFGDLLPVIERTRYRDLLPRAGVGTRGGIGRAIRFGHGPVMRFMSGGGGEKSRAGFTTRVLAVTEVDGLAKVAGVSVEADKLKQLEARTRAYGSRRRIYLECTVTTAEGRIWREYGEGTASRLLLPCPGCGTYVQLERECLLGWQGAETVLDAREAAHWLCPACGMVWTEDDRRQANLAAILVHRGQTVSAEGAALRGETGPGVMGDPPKTDTLGFRWSAGNNLFLTAADLAADEWRAAREPDQDNAEREMRQFVWAIPYETPQVDLTPLDPTVLQRRITRLGRGTVPAETAYLAVGVDLGKYLCHYTVLASRADGGGRIIDYGRFDVAADDLGAERGLVVALREFRDLVVGGWEGRTADLVLVDSGWLPDMVYMVVRESAGATRWLASKGFGFGQEHARWYARPKGTGHVVRKLGDGWHITRLRGQRIDLMEIDADHWKTLLHERLAAPMDAPGAISLFAAPAVEHTAFCRHLTAERRTERIEPSRGTVVRWERVSRSNHWLDATCLALAGAHLLGARLEPAAAGPEVVTSWFSKDR